MEAIIIEDEELTADRLAGLISKHTEITVIQQLHSVRSARKWLEQNSTPQLIFLDIQLGDGNGFEVLDGIATYPHIIFTTAYDQYAIDAFKYNSIDYLLKPIKATDLKNAVEKLDKVRPQADTAKLISELEKQITRKYKQKFLVKVGLKYHSYATSEIAYFYSEESESYLRTKEGTTSIVDHTLDSIEAQVDPQVFFRVNRHMIVNAGHIASIDSYFNNRLSLKLQPEFHETVIVSRDRVKDFKKWMDE
ncbi:MAG: LytTR family DNA-binding domain-containing protein [Ekhidna sp.]